MESLLSRVSFKRSPTAASTSSTNLLWTPFNKLGGRHSEQINKVALTADGTKIITYGSNNTIKLYDVGSSRLLSSYKMSCNIFHASPLISDNRTVLATEGSISILNGNLTELVESIRSPLVNFGTMCCINATLDGTLAYTCHGDGSIRIWDFKSEQLHIVIEAHEGNVLAADSNKNGTLLVSSGKDKTMKLWNGTNGNLIRVFTGHDEEVTSVKFNANAIQIISGSKDHTIKVWDTASGYILHTLVGHTSIVNYVCWSRDNSMILSCSQDTTAKVWNAQTGSLIQSLDGHRDSIFGIVMSDDKSRIVTASDDKIIQIWSS